MSARRATSNVVAADLDLTPGSITHIGIYDHLTPRLQNLLYEAKRFKTANNYKYCWAKNSAIYLRQNDMSRVIKLSRINDLTALSNNATLSAQGSRAQNVEEWLVSDMDPFFYLRWESKTKLR